MEGFLMKHFFKIIVIFLIGPIFALQVKLKPEKTLIHTRIKKDWLGNITSYEYWFVDKDSEYAVAYYERPIHKIMTHVKLIKKDGTLDVPETLFAGLCTYLSSVGYQDAQNEMTICGCGKNLEVLEISAEARDQIC